MFWIDEQDNAYYVTSRKDISIDDYENNLWIMFDDHIITDQYGNGNKAFIAKGIGKCKPGICELIAADSLETCRQMFSERHVQRLAENSLAHTCYYEIVNNMKNVNITSNKNN